MHLKQVEMYGFKSFADRMTIHFDEGITGIVGPNGSGKSNISDAVRWVLGESNPRLLRGGKMEDVIFNGSENRKPFSYCEVNLTIDNSDGALPTEYSEVTVSRRVFRSGESEYYINRTICRRKDIIMLFRDTGIGKEGYSVIGQGRIDAILSNKPDERRAVFQEATGIAKYRSRRDDAMRRLNRTDQNLQRLNDIMGEMESQLEPLRVQSVNARDYLVLSERQRFLDVNGFMLRYAVLSQNIIEQKEILKQIEKEIEGRESGSFEGIKRMDVLRKTFDELEGNIETMRGEVEDLSGILSQVNLQRNVLFERIERLQEENIRLDHEAEQEKARASKLQEEADDLEETLSVGSDNLESHKDKLADYDGQLRDMDENIAIEEARTIKANTEAMEALNKLSDAKSDVARLTAMTDALLKRVEQIDEQKLNTQGDIENCRSAAVEIDDNAIRLASERKKLKELNNEKANDLLSIRSKANTYREDLERIRQRMSAAKTQYNLLNSLKKDYEGYYNSVKRLLKDSRENPEIGKLIKGVIGELIKTPKEYIKAVETALGGALQNIVTPTDRDAGLLIDYLRSKRYGRATFLPLSTIRPRFLNSQEKNVLNSEGCLGVAAQLIQFDDQYSSIFNSLLGRTIIAEDMESAIKMARKVRHSLRFVTLSGDIINTGGSMSGGSSRSNVSSLLGRESQIEEAAKTYKTLNANVAQIEVSIKAENESLNIASKELESVASKLHEVDIMYAREKERLDRAGSLGDSYRLTIDGLDDEKERINSQLMDIKAEIEQASQNHSTLNEGDSELRRQMASSQRKINELREQRDELLEYISDLRAALAADSRERSNFIKQVERLRRDSSDVLAASKRRLKNIFDNENRIKQEKEQMLELSKTGDSGDNQLSDKRSSLLFMIENQASIRDEITELEHELRSSEHSARELIERRYKAELIISNGDNELKSSQNRMWEMYEITMGNAEEYLSDEYNPIEGKKELKTLRNKIKRMGIVNVAAVEEYETLKERYDEYDVQRSDLNKAEDDLMEIINDLNARMEKQFSQQFKILNAHLGETFSRLFGGGMARLIIEDGEDILERGIEIEVQLPGKSKQLITLLSGGERALTATAIILAMLKLRPSPFCIMDEVEAALDDDNLRIFAEYLREFAINTQFIIVTHRKPTMESMDRLYGVTMQERGVSKMISVKMSDYVN